MSRGPVPDYVLAEAFDDDGPFPACHSQIARVVWALKYLRLIDDGEPSRTTALVTEAGLGTDYFNYWVAEAREFQTRTGRGLSELIQAGGYLLEQLQNAREQWEAARLGLLEALRSGARKAIGRPCDRLGEPIPGSIPREIPRLVWHAPVNLTDDGRVVPDGSDSDSSQGLATAQWAYCQVRIVIEETAEAALSTSEASTPEQVQLLSGAPSPLLQTPPRAASQAQIHDAITKVYDHAAAHNMKPPNVVEIAGPVLKLLLGKNVTASGNRIRQLAANERHSKRRRGTGHRVNGTLSPFTDREI
jgi:hypothetical protein